MMKFPSLFKLPAFRARLAWVGGYFVVIALLLFTVFPVGIYSCNDVAAIDGVPADQLTSFVNDCRTRQNIGLGIFAVHFAFPAVGGFFVNQTIGGATGFFSEATFWVPMAGLCLLQIVGIAYILTKVSQWQAKRNRSS